MSFLFLASGLCVVAALAAPVVFALMGGRKAG